MPAVEAREYWGRFSIALHWLTFALVLGLATVGLLMGDMDPSPLKVQVYSLHKSMGLTVLAITALRLLWRLFEGRLVDTLDEFHDLLWKKH